VQRQLAERPGFCMWLPRELRIGNTFQDPSRGSSLLFELLQQTIDERHDDLL
jgi:hypothetical protein